MEGNVLLMLFMQGAFSTRKNSHTGKNSVITNCAAITVHVLPQAKEWVNLFLTLSTKCEGFQRKNITPYIHSLVYHVPEMIKKFGNIKQFSGQGKVSEFAIESRLLSVFFLSGVEKNNDAKRNYFSSNLHDATVEVGTNRRM